MQLNDKKEKKKQRTARQKLVTNYSKLDLNKT